MRDAPEKDPGIGSQVATSLERAEGRDEDKPLVLEVGCSRECAQSGHSQTRGHCREQASHQPSEGDDRVNPPGSESNR